MPLSRIFPRFRRNAPFYAEQNFFATAENLFIF